MIHAGNESVTWFCFSASKRALKQWFFGVFVVQGLEQVSELQCRTAIITCPENVSLFFSSRNKYVSSPLFRGVLPLPETRRYCWFSGSTSWSSIAFHSQYPHRSVCFQGGRGNGGRLHSRHLDGRKSPAENARSTKHVARHHSCRRPESSLSAAVSLHVFHQQTDGSEGALDSSYIGVAKPGF